MYYTKYRPQKFSEISQPNDTAKALMSQLSTNKAGHAYLFVGPRGTGKTTTARILAKALNCTNLDKNGDPCLECTSCEAIKHGNFIDLIEIDAASNRGIDDIRELKDKIKLSPSEGAKKVYIIDEVHMLTTEAFNALLKTLEEPPSHAAFVLCTTELHKVPDTIKSRCQVFKFKRATRQQLVQKLENILKAEGVDYLKTSDLEKIAEASFGGFRDAETILQQVVEGSLDPETFVGLASQQVYVEFVNSLINSNAKDALHTVSKLADEGLDIHVWSLGLLSYLRDLMFVKADAHDGMIDVSEDVLKHMQAQSKDLDFERITFFIEVFLKASNEIDDSPIPNLPLEVATLKICKGIANFNVDSSTIPQGSGDHDTKPTSNSSATKVSGDTTKVASKDTSESGKKSTNKAKNEAIAEAKLDVTDEDVTIEYLEEDEVPEGIPIVKVGNSDIDDFGEDFEEDDDDDDEEIETNEALNTDVPIIEITVVTENWRTIVKEIVQIDTSTHTLLKSASPLDVKGNILHLEVMYAFHKERLETAKNRKILEDVLEKVLGEKLAVSCTVNASKRPKKSDKRETGNLTDANIAAPVFSSGEMNDNINDIFDGGLPL